MNVMNAQNKFGRSVIKQQRKEIKITKRKNNNYIAEEFVSSAILKFNY
jgi:hypothetical protein